MKNSRKCPDCGAEDNRPCVATVCYGRGDILYLPSRSCLNRQIEQANDMLNKIEIAIDRNKTVTRSDRGEEICINGDGLDLISEILSMRKGKK